MSAWGRRVWCPCSLESPSRAGASARPAVVNTHCSVAPTWEGLSPGVHWDLAKSRPDRFCQIMAIQGAGDVLRVPVRSQIARARADFERFSEMRGNLGTEVWSRVDLNSRPLLRLSSQNCPRIWRGICSQIKAAVLQRASSPDLSPPFLSLQESVSLRSILARIEAEHSNLIGGSRPLVFFEGLPSKCLTDTGLDANRELAEAELKPLNTVKRCAIIGRVVRYHRRDKRSSVLLMSQLSRRICVGVVAAVAVLCVSAAVFTVARQASAGEAPATSSPPTVTETVLYSFCNQPDHSTGACLDGETPNGLIQGSDGNFYGTTGPYGDVSGGTMYKLTPSGTLTTLHSFCPQKDPNSGDCLDGYGPGGVIEGSDGNFYGTAGSGGANFERGGGSAGTAYMITPSGARTTSSRPRSAATTMPRLCWPRHRSPTTPTSTLTGRDSAPSSSC